MGNVERLQLLCRIITDGEVKCDSNDRIAFCNDWVRAAMQENPFGMALLTEPHSDPPRYPRYPRYPRLPRCPRYQYGGMSFESRCYVVYRPACCAHCLHRHAVIVASMLKAAETSEAQCIHSDDLKRMLSVYQDSEYCILTSDGRPHIWCDGMMKQFWKPDWQDTLRALLDRDRHYGQLELQVLVSLLTILTGPAALSWAVRRACHASEHKDTRTFKNAVAITVAACGPLSMVEGAISSNEEWNALTIRACVCDHVLNNDGKRAEGTDEVCSTIEKSESAFDNTISTQIDDALDPIYRQLGL